MKTKTALRLAMVTAFGTSVVFCQPQSRDSAPATFVGSDGSTFKLEAVALTAGPYVPAFRAIVTNQSVYEWESVSLAATVEIDCQGESPRRVDFVTSIGDLKIGANKIFDTIFPARDLIHEGCSDPLFLKLEFAQGTKLSQQQTAEKQSQRRRVDAEIEEGAKHFNAEEILRRQRESICRDLYIATVDRKVSDLTVRESKLMNACSELDYYHD